MSKSLIRMPPRERMILFNDMFPEKNSMLLNIGFEESNNMLYKWKQFVFLVYKLKNFSDSEIINIVNKYYFDDIIYYCDASPNLSNFEFKFINRAKIIKNEIRYDVENATEFVHGVQLALPTESVRLGDTKLNVSTIGALCEIAIEILKNEALGAIDGTKMLVENFNADKGAGTSNYARFPKFKNYNPDKVLDPRSYKIIYDESLLYDVDEHIFPLFRKIMSIGIFIHIDKFNELKIQQLTDSLMTIFIADKYDGLPDSTIEQLMEATTLICLLSVFMKHILIDRTIHVDPVNTIVEKYVPKGTGIYENILYFFESFAESFFPSVIDEIISVFGKKMKTFRLVDAAYKLILKMNIIPIVFYVTDDLSKMSIPENYRPVVSKKIRETIEKNKYILPELSPPDTELRSGNMIYIPAIEIHNEKKDSAQQMIINSQAEIVTKAQISSANSAKSIVSKLRSYGISEISEDSLTNFAKFSNKEKESGFNLNVLSNTFIINFRNELCDAFSIPIGKSITNLINMESNAIRNSLLETISAVIGTANDAKKFASIFLEQIHQLELSDISINSYEFKKQKANEMNEMRYMIYLKLSPEEKIENNIAKMTHEQIIDFLDEKIKDQL